MNLFNLFIPPFISQVLEAKVNEVKINEAREHYRPVAVRASLLYFIMNDLNKINPVYQFSLKVSKQEPNKLDFKQEGVRVSLVL